MNGYQMIENAKREKRERFIATVNGRRLGAVAALREALVDAGAEVVSSPGAIDKVNGEYLGLAVASERSGRIAFAWGGYRDRNRRPEPKRGFKFAEIAETIIVQVARRKRERERRNAVEQARLDAGQRARHLNDELNEEFGLGDRIVKHPVEAYTNSEGFQMNLHIRNVDAATARRVLAAVTKALEEV